MIDQPRSWRTASISSEQLSYHQRFMGDTLITSQRWVGMGTAEEMGPGLWQTNLARRSGGLHPSLPSNSATTRGLWDIRWSHLKGDHISKASWYGHSWRNGSRAMVDQPRSQIWRTASIASEQLSYIQRCVGDTLITSQRWSHLKGELVWAQLKKWVQGYGRPTSLTDLEDCIHRFRATQLPPEVYGRYVDHISKVSWYGHSWRNGSRAMVDQPRSQIWRTVSIASEQLSYHQRCMGDALITSQRWSSHKVGNHLVSNQIGELQQPNDSLRATTDQKKKLRLNHDEIQQTPTCR